jgi:hypothetical protein
MDIVVGASALEPIADRFPQVAIRGFAGEG